MFLGKRILAIGAHPDDIEYGCFGTLYRYRLETEIYCYIATNGGLNDETSNGLRLAHSVDALSALEPKCVYERNGIGISLDDYAYVARDLERIIKHRQIDLILTHTKHDTHQDHRIMFEITLSAARRLPITILVYAPLSSTPQFQPTVFVDVFSCFHAKQTALNYHTTQYNKSYMKTAFLKAYHSDSFAFLHGFPTVERFELIRSFQ